MYSTTSFSQFEIVYGFNHLTPLYLIHLPVDGRFHVNDNRKAHVVKDLYAMTTHIKKIKQYVYKANKRRELVRFELGN
jgi:hypothetical protein